MLHACCVSFQLQFQSRVDGYVCVGAVGEYSCTVVVFPEYCVVAARGCRGDVSEEFVCSRIGDRVCSRVVDGKMDSRSKKRFVHIVIAAAATRAYRLIDRLTDCRITGSECFLSKKVVAGDIVDTAVSRASYELEPGIVEAPEKGTGQLELLLNKAGGDRLSESRS